MDSEAVGFQQQNPVKLVQRPSDLDPYDDDPEVFRSELSCGHVTGPETLKEYCRVQLESGKTEMRCPECKKEWPYVEVRQVANLTSDEKGFFERTLGKNAARKVSGIKTCRGCSFSIVRSDPSNLCFKCTVCSERTGKTSKFCWQCLREWKGPCPRSDGCDNKNCVNEDMLMVLNCETITFPHLQNIECPSVRACPTCGCVTAHNGEKCKNVKCSRCNNEFCFFCLKLASECKMTSSAYGECSAGVAPRQTSIPFLNI
ncbi:putative protein ariadne-2 [Astyanax mexicanus]|uniref:RING-type domain-containing protein n=1 Tax=Astyanax mexicanus TaxID=7994 RepID=A0A8T2MHN3_ASTMX|nr:putative protein ariadne-2 [Astyanax mexicanus]